MFSAGLYQTNKPQRLSPTPLVVFLGPLGEIPTSGVMLSTANPSCGSDGILKK